MREVHLQAQVPAPPEVVWKTYTDHRGWVDWAGVREVVLRQEGDPPPNGLGAIRVVRAWGIAVEEEITAFEPPRRMVYRLAAGAPLRNHEGEVSLEACDGGTRVTWRVRFDPLVPGTGALVARVLERVLRGILDRLTRHSFEPTPSGH